MVVVSSVPVVLCFASVFLASSAHGGGVDDAILEYNFTRDKNGGYFYRFKTSNGIERQETGQVVEADDKDSVILQVIGYYKFLRENGAVEEVKYSAGKNGFVVLPSAAEHQQFRKQKLAGAKQKELLLPAEEGPVEPDDDDEEVGTRIQSCVIASLCGTAPFGG